MNNIQTWNNVTLSNVKVKKAKNNNEYVSGNVIFYTDDNKYENSESFVSFDHVQAFLPFVVEGTEAKADRPRGSITGYVSKKKSSTKDASGNDVWIRNFNIVSFTKN